MQRRQMLSTGLAAMASLLVAGCGFRLRGQVDLPFRSMYVQGPDSALLQMLRRSISGQTQLAATATQAEAVLNLLSERQEQVSVVVTGSGQVRDVQLREHVEFSLTGANGQPLLEKTVLRVVRDVSYNESEALSKQAEFDLMYRDMRNDVVQQILRRVAAVRPAAAK